MTDDSSKGPGAAGAPPDDEPDRLAEPVDTEKPPRLPFPVVGIGASAGGLEAASEFFGSMRPDSGMAFVLIQHLPPQRDSMLAEILSRRTQMKVGEVTDQMPVEPDHVYVIRPGHTLTIKDGRLHLGEPLEKPGHRRPVDDFFRSLAEEQRERAIGVVLSGMGSNGSAGAQSIKAVGGLCIAQEPESAKFPDMPRNLIEAGCSDLILKPGDMPEAIVRFAQHPYVAGRRGAESPLQKERQHLNDILTILRARTRHEFSGYKKPTILRRIHRRMGLNQVTKLSEYSKLLRHRPGEATALADDLVIHVTGFFRDSGTWDALRTRVIDPLVKMREDDTDIRVWVTACSSGEEAYTLAILLTEAIEAAGKHLDVKIFATDTAERTLTHARNGIYPNGIESEMSPQRLERFFDKEDSVYRIKKDLREMVVFAPQNVLQDPPFSRLDIITCRNLLIYLEADAQRRVLTLLHFGLREGGALFLGNSETVSAVEEMFEAIDKKSRIYRRIGPTRHGLVDFPLPHGVTRRVADRTAEQRPSLQRHGVPQMAQQALLARFTPAAVVVDRLHRVVYFHGPTEQFIAQPEGEPTRELLDLAREPVRSAVRAALHKAESQSQAATVRDGVMEINGQPRRIEVNVLPLREGADPPSYFLVSFEDHPVQPESPIAFPGAAGDADHRQMNEELGRIRDELQSTIEELQTSNEEMKASNEEITSVNEELQSANEELETSKEELQSLNEELTTVNAQLHAKMEELERMTNDLSSLLSSTDIAVLFLDSNFHIRRHTPAMRNLLDLIPSDIGRPINDMARKFDDPNLLSDAQAVLDKLIPIEREISSADGRWYVRRILPYRTIDNRIEGVVVTFVDMTERKVAEQSLRVLEERRRLALEASGAGDWEFDPHERQFYLSSLVRGLLGVSVGETESVDRVMSLVYADDRNAVNRALEASLEPHGAGIFRVDFRVIQPSRNSLWVELRGRTTFTTPPAGQRTPMRIRGTMLDISDRKIAEQGLLEARISAESASEAKDHFLASVSHELRTPLSTILLWTKMLGDDRSNPQELEEALRAIRVSAEAQKQLIEDLLDTSRITAGKMRLDICETDLAAVVQSAIDTIRPSAEAKGITLKVDIDSSMGIVRADADRLQQVIWNLLINAVKFTPRGGRIESALLRRDEHVEVRVTDTGMGIPVALMPHLFEPFMQGTPIGAAGRSGPDGPLNLRDGLGLGLAIAKRLVELHGGTIEASSAGIDQGATFIVKLPLVAAEGAALTPEASSEAVTAAALQDQGAHIDHELAGCHILVVEDVSITRRALQALLQNAGADVTAVDSAAAAIEAYTAHRPDLIVSDIGLPDTDGVEMMRKIREIESKRGSSPVPALAVTAFTQEKDRRRAIQAGFQQHISKPPDANKLIAMIRPLVKPKA